MSSEKTTVEPRPIFDEQAVHDCSDEDLRTAYARVCAEQLDVSDQLSELAYRREIYEAELSRRGRNA